jgi:hypothetical protein
MNGSQERRPNSSLVVGSIALCRAAGIGSTVSWVAWCEGAKREGGKLECTLGLRHGVKGVVAVR